MDPRRRLARKQVHILVIEDQEDLRGVLCHSGAE
jgi:hypothetical protein